MLPSFTVARSVPELISEATVLTKTPPGGQPGAGTSSTAISCVRKSCKSCFMVVPD